jgi:hypothetical protein
MMTNEQRASRVKVAGLVEGKRLFFMTGDAGDVKKRIAPQDFILGAIPGKHPTDVTYSAARRG